MRALIGYSGFVGTTLLKQAKFDTLYRSSNIEDISGKSFDTVVCCGASAKKWLANKNPQQDRESIEALIESLKKVHCRKFILISTVDVFRDPVGVDEDTKVDEDGLHAYGKNRRRLELFVSQQFEQHLIVRLPGLVGPGLQKNAVFDFRHGNDLDKLDSRSRYQFFPMVNLWSDISQVLDSQISLIHLCAAPISLESIAKHGFNMDFSNRLEQEPAHYDMRTKYASMFGAVGPYQYSVRETVTAIRAYAQSETAESLLKVAVPLP